MFVPRTGCVPLVKIRCTMETLCAIMFGFPSFCSLYIGPMKRSVNV